MECIHRYIGIWIIACLQSQLYAALVFYTIQQVQIPQGTLEINIPVPSLIRSYVFNENVPPNDLIFVISSTFSFIKIDAKAYVHCTHGTRMYFDHNYITYSCHVQIDTESVNTFVKAFIILYINSFKDSFRSLRIHEYIYNMFM